VVTTDLDGPELPEPGTVQPVKRHRHTAATDAANDAATPGLTTSPTVTPGRPRTDYDSL
jgi:hypothetical protein